MKRISQARRFSIHEASPWLVIYIFIVCVMLAQKATVPIDHGGKYHNFNPFFSFWPTQRVDLQGRDHSQAKQHEVEAPHRLNLILLGIRHRLCYNPAD